MDSTDPPPNGGYTSIGKKTLIKKFLTSANIMKKIFALTTLLALSNLSNAQSNTYTFDAGGLISSNTDTDSSSQSIRGIGGTYYFQPLNVEGDEPYAERHFVQKSSNATILYGTDQYATSTFNTVDINQLRIAGELHINNIVGGVDNSSWKATFPIKSSPQYSYEIKSDANEYYLGYYFAKYNLITFSQRTSTASYTRSSNLLTNLTDLNITKNLLKSKNLFKLGQDQFAVLNLRYGSVQYKNSSDQSNSYYSISGRYYPSKKLYLEAAYSAEQGDKKVYAGNTMGLEFGLAITPRLMASLSSSQFTASDVASGGTNNITNTFLVSYRF
jgi:hypothetical protein